MRIDKLILNLLFSLTVVSASSAVSENIRLKATVNQLPGEVDIANNTRELEVTVCSQAFTDLAISDISISHEYVMANDTVSVSVVVENKGNNGEKGDGSYF